MANGEQFGDGFDDFFDPDEPEGMAPEQPPEDKDDITKQIFIPSPVASSQHQVNPSTASIEAKNVLHATLNLHPNTQDIYILPYLDRCSSLHKIQAHHFR